MTLKLLNKLFFPTLWKLHGFHQIYADLFSIQNGFLKVVTSNLPTVLIQNFQLLLLFVAYFCMKMSGKLNAWLYLE